MSKPLFYFAQFSPCPAESYNPECTAEDLEAINGLRANGPLRKLTTDDIFVRSMIILGEEPTTRMSIHPEGNLNGKEVKILSSIVSLLPGAPMMEGHDTARTPWGRVYKAALVENAKRKCKTAQIWYYFLKNGRGVEIANEIDAGIRSEGSISYFFKKAACSICHADMIMTMFGGMNTCNHKLGQKYDGQVCYWYPQSIDLVAEVSHVFRGAYRHTKSVVNVAYGADEAEGYDQVESFINTKLEEQHAEPEQHSDGAASPADPLGVQPPAADGAGSAATASAGTSGSPEPAPAPAGEPVAAAHSEPVPPEAAAGQSASASGDAPLDGSQPAGTDLNAVPPPAPAAPEVPVVPPVALAGDEPAPVPAAGESPLPSHKYSLCGKCGKRAEFSAGALCCGEAMLGVDFDAPAAAIELVPAPAVAELVTVGRVVGPVKPKKSGVANNEFFELEDFRNLPDGEYYVEPKYDGVYFEVHKDGDQVKLFTDTGAEHSHQFPGLVAEVQKLKQDKLILVGEMVKYRGRQRLTHVDVTRYIHSKGPYEDYHFKFKAFDIPFLGGADLTGKPLSERQAALDGIADGDQLHKVVLRKANTGARVISAINEVKTREGAMIKAADAKYTQEDAAKYWKWKRQYEIDCRVKAIEIPKDGGGFVYVCEVGHGAEAQEIGRTYVTSVEAKVGDILRVTVDYATLDEQTGKYTWYAPKVVSVREDKSEPDPLSVMRRIAEKKENSSKSSNVITLGEVVPKLKAMSRDWGFWLCGGLVEKGFTTHDIDIVFKEEPTPEQRAAIENALGDVLSEYLDICVDPTGPAGPCLLMVADMSAESLAAWKYAGQFVLQKHWWGKKDHWDLRFGAPKTPRMWGFTCFKEPTKEAGGPKVRCQEKKYHDPSWMDVDGEIKIGEVGNPTKNLTAYMKILDKGKYDFIKRKPGFLEVVLHGKEWNGRYVFREIAVKGDHDALVAGDESDTKDNKIWIMWKPQDQTPSAPVHKLAFKYDRGVLIYWESAEIDSSLS